MYEIEFMPGPGLLRWRMTGFWTEAMADAFQVALHAEMARVRTLQPRFYCLSDTRDFPVQSEPVMRKLGGIAKGAANDGVRKFAILVSTALNTLQAQRSFRSDRIRVFKDEDEALAWLTEYSSGARDAA